MVLLLKQLEVRRQFRRRYQPLGDGHTIWLFADNDAAAENHARLWSLIASCERHGVDPQRYLTSVLAKIGQTPINELDQFKTIRSRMLTGRQGRLSRVVGH